MLLKRATTEHKPSPKRSTCQVLEVVSPLLVHVWRENTQRRHKAMQLVHVSRLQLQRPQEVQVKSNQVPRHTGEGSHEGVVAPGPRRRVAKDDSDGRIDHPTAHSGEVASAEEGEDGAKTPAPSSRADQVVDTSVDPLDGVPRVPLARRAKEDDAWEHDKRDAHRRLRGRARRLQLAKLAGPIDVAVPASRIWCAA